ncbi:hypothetical protein HKX54_06485 [Sulfitobacter sp. M57]|uniref:hypothetical protein n=1 Tax=unclassified Sulfitobacter TaxID=196795 RepID=UPI0023E0FC44|nr:MULTISPECIES: hypothetical protein [unclassified Sulfitobacter]MDF3414095.1 hypothetical protein [Sulfitobacter sp. KE5]MDF3420624.1 hypothetical protein [Sulfitobacter sp. KE43]MDF3432641.1 hypothetical protein [Sulfitobacter sp. KE42]MDF3458280.1 hypothetical protein [Sulfitobacter sp. S74]MDF3462181.1 hypothetical protein [Sulfitobacter sp. Ks18]
MSAAFTFAAQGRNLRTAVVVLAVWAALMVLWMAFDAAHWLVALLALFTLPACLDLTRNPVSGLTLTGNDIAWYTGRRNATVALAEIDHVRFDTRLDFSVKVTLVLKTGAKLRLPFEATPPHHALEAALSAQGLTTKRFHFQLMQ